MSSAGPVVVATDLTEFSRPALLRGQGHADAIGAPLIACHVVLDVFRHHPLVPNPQENDFVFETNLITRAADLVTEQVSDVLKADGGKVRVVVESGDPEEEIVRLAEKEGASLIAVGAKPREGAQRVLGHVAEKIVRYAHTSVLIARASKATGKALVATDFNDGSLPALRVAGEIAKSIGVQVTLLHVVEAPSTLLSSALSPFGDTWMPPSKTALDQLSALGKRTLEDLAKQYGFAGVEQVEGDPADVIASRAEALDVEMIIMGSRGRRGLARLVMGSVAENVIRHSHCSVLIAR